LVIVHHVPPELADRFVELQEDITTAAKLARGYVRTEVYPPADPDSDQWVVVMTFADQDCLDRWFESPERIRRISKMREEIGEFSVRKLPSGFGEWFAGLDPNDGGAPVEQLPGWKMVLAVLLALYPTVMLITIFINPWLSGLGLASTILIGSAISVCLLQYALMPALTSAIRRWLRTPFNDAPLLIAGGALGIVAALGCLAVLFRQFTG